MALSAKAVRIFAAVEVLRDNQADIRHALATLFEPDLAKFHGQVFDAGLLADEINRQYHLGISREVVEGFADIFQSKGWISKITEGDRVAFVVNCDLYSNIPTEITKFAEQASRLAREFREFIMEIAPINQVNKDDSELIDSLVEWLLTLDRAHEDDIRAASTAYRVGTKIVFGLDEKTEGRPPSEDVFLSARFVDYLFKNKSEFIPFLVELAEVGLVTEVVRDFQRPMSPATRSDLCVYLDAPLAMDYLGLSGAPPQESVASLLDGVRKLGGCVRIFRESVEEMQAALSAVLNRPIPERTGPTADALRRREVLEPFVRQVASKPDTFLQAKNIGIVDQTLEMFPNEHKFFPRAAYEDLYSQVAWVRDDAARHHDAAIATMVMRKRTGVRSGDVFDTKHVVLTRNPLFPNLSRRIARDHSLIGPNHVGPVIHQRQLATAVWLRIGAGRDSEIPRSYILAACRRVLTLRKNIVEKVHQFKSSLTGPQAEQLEILLGESRSTQILMDKTLGSASFIDSRNIELLLEEMKKAQIEDYRIEKDQEVADAKKQARDEVRELKRSLRDAENLRAEALSAAMSTAESALSDAQKYSLQLDQVVERFIGKLNKSIRRRRLIWGFSLVISFAFVTFVGFYASGSSGILRDLAFIFVLLVGGIVQFNGWLGRFLLAPFFRDSDHRLFHSMALDHGLDSDDAMERVQYDGEAFKLVSVT